MGFLSHYPEREADVVQLERHSFAEKIEREGIEWKPKSA